MGTRGSCKFPYRKPDGSNNNMEFVVVVLWLYHFVLYKQKVDLHFRKNKKKNLKDFVFDFVYQMFWWCTYLTSFNLDAICCFFSLVTSF